MKVKKGLGRIPKSLSWIDQVEESIMPSPAKEVPTEVPHRQQKSAEVLFERATKSTQKGVPTGWIRATFIVNQDLNESIKAFAYWERLTVKEVIHEALTSYMRGKNVKPIPKKKNIL
jgi:hypothetical protein